MKVLEKIKLAMKCLHYSVYSLKFQFYVFLFWVFNWEENKEVGTICFETRIPMKKPKILMEFFHESFWKSLFKFGFNNSILEKIKNIYGNTFTMKKPLKNTTIKLWKYHGNNSDTKNNLSKPWDLYLVLGGFRLEFVSIS